MDLSNWEAADDFEFEDYTDDTFEQNFLDSMNVYMQGGGLNNQKQNYSQYFFGSQPYIKEEADPTAPFFVPVKQEPLNWQQQQKLQPQQQQQQQQSQMQQQQQQQPFQQKMSAQVQSTTPQYQQMSTTNSNFMQQTKTTSFQKLNSNQPPLPNSSHPSEVDIIIDGQPPVEVRTRTPSELRTFSVTGRVVGAYKQLGASIVNIELAYAATDHLQSEVVKKDILGGTKTVPILADGSIVFDNLSMSESSTKHKEREFCLEFVLLRNDGHELLRKRSRAFYAYSHKKVLQRRGSVKLRTLSKSWGSMAGGDQMHVIGSPFIQGPALSFIFRTPHGDVFAKPIEYFSDSVLFFTLPPYPLPQGMTVAPNTEVKVVALVTNDGRTYSNPLEFVYVADVGSRART